MMSEMLECPHCHNGVFSARLAWSHTDPLDTHTYIELHCQTCRRFPAMMFVVDLTPEFEHATS